MTTHDELVSRLHELVGALPDEDFEIWTSNSWRRIYFGHRSPAIEPCVQRTDNHPDLIFAPGVAAYLEAVGPKSIRMLLDLVEQQARRIAYQEDLNRHLRETADAGFSRRDRDITALRSDIEDQIAIAKEACERATQYEKDAARYRMMRSQPLVCGEGLDADLDGMIARGEVRASFKRTQ